MSDKGTKKKIIRVEGGETASGDVKPFVASAESKARAGKLRFFSVISWLVAIGLEVGAILLLRKPPVQTVWLVVLIVADLLFAVLGSLMWKKANRLDPASEKQPVRFFIQNQLGAIITVIAFLPLVILIFTSKDLKGKQKGLLGGVAVVAMLIAGYVGIDFNPPSQEQYAQQTAQVETLTGANHVYWTKSGSKYHLFSDCQHINTRKTDEIFEGTVAQARELKNISELCKTCEGRWTREKGLPETTPPPADGEKPGAGEELSPQ